MKNNYFSDLIKLIAIYYSGETMKKLFEILGIIALMSFSFFYTEKTLSVVKENDEIMIEIKEKKEQFEKEAIDANIIDDKITPGIHGLEVDLDSSYSKMRRYGKYNESLIVTKEKNPEISIKDNYDKFVIGGNEKLNKVSFTFLATKDSKIDKILNTLKEKEIYATFFIDFYFYEDTKLKTISSLGHEIGNLSINYNYKDATFAWLNTKIKKYQDHTYCYSDDDNKETLLLCSISEIYTISPSIITDTKPLYEIKKQLKNGSIISFHINENLEKELPLIINYIKGKGLDIVPLEELLKE